MTKENHNRKSKVSEQVKQTIVERIREGLASAAGESRRLGIPESTIRNWVKYAKDRDEKRRLETLLEAKKILEEPPPAPKHAHLLPEAIEPQDVLLKDLEERTNTVKSTENPSIVEQIRMAAFDGFSCSAEGLRRLREKAPATVNHIVDTLIEAIAQIRLDLQEGKTYRHAIFQGDITEHKVNMTIADKQNAVRTLQSLTEQFVKLAVIPYGAIDPSRLIEPRESINQQHVHLHSHGSVAHKPLEINITADSNKEKAPPPAIAQEVGALNDWQKALLS